MSTDVTEILKKTAEYIATTQPMLDKVAEERALFVKRARSAADVLVERGVLPRKGADKFVAKLAESPEHAFDVIVGLAGKITAEPLGKSAQGVVPARKLTAFEALYYYDDPTKTNPGTPALLD